MTTIQSDGAPPGLCADCNATLVEDQCYCLQCGARRGKPRVDFTAFWRPSSATGARHESDGERHEGAVGAGSWFGAKAPPRRVVGALAAATLAVGIVVGAALGPAPASSPADSSTLEQRALAALVTRASSDSPVAGSPSPTVAPSESEATTEPARTHRAKSPSKAASTAASTPTSSESSSSTESSAGTPSSEGGSPEDTSSQGPGESEKTTPGTPVKLPPIKHVWLIALSGESFADALTQSHTDPYLAKQLVPKGTLLSNYTLSAPSELANGLALLSGQSVNLDTEQNCPTYAELQPPTIDAANGLAEGVGCVYPPTVQTLAGELTDAGLTWKAYIQSMQEGATAATGSAPSAPPGTGPTPTGAASPQQAASALSCRHPELGASDPNQAPTPGDPYLTFRNPLCTSIRCSTAARVRATTWTSTSCKAIWRVLRTSRG